MKNENKTMDIIVNLAKSRGFVYPGSEIYGGLANSWDYGPLGVELKNNVKKAWWKKFIQDTNLNVGLDCAILMNPETWVASGHVGSFSDPLVDCKACNSIYLVKGAELEILFCTRINAEEFVHNRFSPFIFLMYFPLSVI